LDVHKRREREREIEAVLSKENETSSSREMVCEKPKCRKYSTKYQSFGFTDTGIDGEERP